MSTEDTVPSYWWYKCFPRYTAKPLLLTGKKHQQKSNNFSKQESNSVPNIYPYFIEGIFINDYATAFSAIEVGLS
jgi:hypothetical protein